MCPSASVPRLVPDTCLNAFVVLQCTVLPVRKLQWQTIQWHCWLFRKELHSVGFTHEAAFVQKLCNVLWYMDGHHGTLSERVLAPLQSFTGYNTLELSKHRKRTKENLKSCVLEQCHYKSSS